MKYLVRTVSIMAVTMGWLAVSVDSASAQTIVRATYRISLTDPATGSVFYTDRESLRSWASEESCEREKESFSGFHTDKMIKENIMNSGGQSLEVKMASIHCVVIRE